MMLQQGIQQEVILGRLGLTQISVTLEICQQVPSSLRDEAGAGLGSLLFGAAVDAQFFGEHFLQGKTMGLWKEPAHQQLFGDPTVPSISSPGVEPGKRPSVGVDSPAWGLHPCDPASD
jgi:hypothetical protein